MSERAIPDVWEVFGKQAIRRNNSWQKMMTEEEKTVTDLFSDLHLHAGGNYITAGDGDDDDAPIPTKKNSSSKTDEYNNERNNRNNGGWENIERHLSMKKTIRKKMMRDLQQAFIDGQDPADPVPQWGTTGRPRHEPNLLDMLKAPAEQQMPPPSLSSSPAAKKPGFWKKLTTRKNKR